MLSRLKAYKTEKGKFIKFMPKPITNILSISCKIQVEIDKLPGWKQFLELLPYFLKLPVRIKFPKSVIDIGRTRLLQIAIIVEEANAQYWNLPYYKAENLNLNVKRFSRGTHSVTTRLNTAYVCFTRI